MTAAPRVSIVVPHYNGSRTLGDTIRSVEAQSFSDWELIIVDDGSSEDERERIRSYAGPRIRIIDQENQGPAAATQRALEAATGVYIAFLDHDDVWHPEKLARDVRLLDAHPELDLVFCGFQWIDEQGTPLAAPHRPPADRFDARALCVDYCIGPTSTVTVRAAATRAVGPLNTSLHRYYDFEYFLRVAALRPMNVGATRDALTCYRRHAGQLSGDPSGMRSEWGQVVDAVRRCPGVDGRVVAQAQSNMHRYFAFLEYERQHFGDGLGLLLTAFRFAPTAFVCEPRNWLAGGACAAGLVLPASVREAAQRLVSARLDPAR